MGTKYADLLNYLLDNRQIVNSATLSQVLHVSVRTVKNYISDINKTANAKVIISGKDGYSINRALAHAFLSKENVTSPQTYDERAIYIMKQFLFEHFTCLDAGELCDNLYISDTTLRSDIVRMNKTYSVYNIQFRLEKDNLVLKGSERDLRKLISTTIYDEVGNNYVNLDTVSANFPRFDAKLIAPIVRLTFSDYNYYINDVAMVNMVLHIAIIIDRIIDGKHVDNTFHHEAINDLNMQVTESLCRKFESSYGISINNDERKEIYILTKANANIAGTSNLSELKDYIGARAFDITFRLIKLVEEKYMIDLSNQRFAIPFALHIKNLIYRSEEDKTINNPMVDNIMYSYPIVFDIAVFMSMQLIDKFRIRCSKSETSFLALHIGGEIERQKLNEAKISTVLLCPSYMNLETKVYNSILLNFSNDLNIIATVHSVNQLANLDFDLLISTVNIEEAGHYEQIIIAPFATQLNKVDIQAKIEKCQSNIKNRVLKMRFDDYFSKDLFYINPAQINNPEQAICFMASNLIKKEYVRDDFTKKVLEREKAASTAFNSIAIPHSMESDAYKTSISVMIVNSGILWEQQNVKIILLMSMSPYESQDFSHLYEALVVLFSNDDNVTLFNSCRNFNEFKNTLMSLII